MARYDHVTKIHQSLTADHASLVPRDIRATCPYAPPGGGEGGDSNIKKGRDARRLA